MNKKKWGLILEIIIFQSKLLFARRESFDSKNYGNFPPETRKLIAKYEYNPAVNKHLPNIQLLTR